jgi:hypothetical protein
VSRLRSYAYGCQGPLSESGTLAGTDMVHAANVLMSGGDSFAARYWHYRLPPPGIGGLFAKCVTGFERNHVR